MYFLSTVVACQYQLPEKTHHQKYLVCVDWDSKLFQLFPPPLLPY